MILSLTAVHTDPAMAWHLIVDQTDIQPARSKAIERANLNNSMPPTSYGVLLYRRLQQEGIQNKSNTSKIEYLLGLIPQRNFWTVFKGLPEAGETPHETALREFAEETGTMQNSQNRDNTTSTAAAALTELSPVATLHGQVGKKKKKLVIFLQSAPQGFFDTSFFDISKVVTIDSGYMEGKPEIVAIQWLSFEEALNGTNDEKRPKIYPSQIPLLEQAENILRRQQEEQTEPSSVADGVEADDELCGDSGPPTKKLRETPPPPL